MDTDSRGMRVCAGGWEWPGEVQCRGEGRRHVIFESIKNFKKGEFTIVSYGPEIMETCVSYSL